MTTHMRAKRNDARGKSLRLRVSPELVIAVAGFLVSLAALFVALIGSPLSGYVTPRILFRVGEETFPRHTDGNKALWRIDVDLENDAKVAAERVEVSLRMTGQVFIRPDKEEGRTHRVENGVIYVLYNTVNPSSSKRLMFFIPLKEMPDPGDVSDQARDRVNVTLSKGVVKRLL